MTAVQLTPVQQAIRTHNLSYAEGRIEWFLTASSRAEHA